jgi:ubiquinone/menaquinone biosynthesis C-methylase UbiE
VLDLLPERHSQPGRRSRFFEEHRARLERFGLRPPTIAPPDPGFTAQAHQREHFDDLALRQDRFSYGALGRQPFQLAIRSLNFEEWARLLRPGTLAIDIGCADGLSTFDIARYGVETVGFDVSPEQLARAQARAQRDGVRNVSFMVADANTIPFDDATVDCVLCYGSLHHVPDPERTIAEIARVLAGGGCYLGLENNTTPLRPVFDALMRLCPIWLEEAGAEAQIGADQLRRWSAGTGLHISTRATVFVPPHVCNWIGYRAAHGLLRLTNWVFSRIPLVRGWGGLITIRGERSLPARAAATAEGHAVTSTSPETERSGR